MTTRGRPLRFVLVVVAVVVAADQAFKAVITSSLFLGERVELLPGLALVSVRNRGIAFGLLGNGDESLVIAVTLVALGILIVVFARAAAGPWGWLGVGLIGGGALGNLVDRVRDGAVVDYIKIDLWPAFNLADAAITVGVVLLLVGQLQRDRAEQPGGESPELDATAPDGPLSPGSREVGGSIGDPS